MSVTGLDGGIYSVSVVDNSTNCTDELTGIEIQNNNFNIVQPIATTDATCDTADGSITITLDDASVFPVTYVLTRDEAGFTPLSGNAAANGFVISGLEGGTYNIEVTSTALGCTATAADIVVNQPTDVQNLQISGTTEVCDVNPSTTLTATSNNGTNYTWIGPSGPAGNTASITATESGTYTVTADAPGVACPTSESVIVTLTVQPDIEIIQIGDVCDGSLVLEAQINNENPNATYNFAWSTGENTRRITVTADGTYDVTVREAGDLTCTGTDSETIDFPEELEATLSSSPACDDGQPITLTVDILSGNANNFTWTRNGQAAGIGNPLVVNEEGSYTVTISDNSGCSIERSILIRRSGIPEGLLPDLEYYCPTSSNALTLTAGIGFETYEWTLNGQPFAGADQDLVVNAAGIYQVTMTTAAGCVRVDQIEIIESCDPVILAPNVIVPEGNPPNNVFSVVPNGFVSDFQIFIYSRWGELIYQSNVVEFQWNGTFNGQLVPIGTYPYVIKFKSRFQPERGEFEQRGAITVVR